MCPNVCISEKVIYFLLLDRKKRKPSYEDDTEVSTEHPSITIGIAIKIIIVVIKMMINHHLLKVMVRARCGSQDPPRKRIDHCKMNGVCFRSSFSSLPSASSSSSSLASSKSSRLTNLQVPHDDQNT